MGTKKQKQRIQKRRKATKAVKALGRRRAEQLTDWLYEGYASHYKPDIHYRQYVKEYDDEIVKSVFGRTRFKNFNISFEDLQTFYGMRRKRFKRRQEREHKKRLEQQCIRIVFLGTANADAVNFYNTCFAVINHKQAFLVDAGGGQTIIRQLRKAQIGFHDIHDIFITHQDMDHLMGLFWLLRDITRQMSDGKYEGDLRVYGHDEILKTIQEVSKTLLPEKVTKYFNTQIKFIEVHNDETLDIIGQEITFFDTHSSKVKQFGFTMKTKNDVTFTYLGDEPYNDSEEKYAKNADYLVHEAFCKESDKRIFKPHEKGHSTLKDACENFRKLDARYLIITHTEDNLGDKRGPQYRHVAVAEHHTPVMVPEDLETIFLKKPSKQRSYFDSSAEEIEGLYESEKFEADLVSDIETELTNPDELLINTDLIEDGLPFNIYSEVVNGDGEEGPF